MYDRSNAQVVPPSFSARRHLSAGGGKFTLSPHPAATTSHSAAATAAHAATTAAHSAAATGSDDNSSAAAAGPHDGSSAPTGPHDNRSAAAHAAAPDATTPVVTATVPAPPVKAVAAAPAEAATPSVPASTNPDLANPRRTSSTDNRRNRNASERTRRDLIEFQLSACEAVVWRVKTRPHRLCLSST